MPYIITQCEARGDEVITHDFATAWRAATEQVRERLEAREGDAAQHCPKCQSAAYSERTIGIRTIRECFTCWYRSKSC